MRGSNFNFSSNDYVGNLKDGIAMSLSKEKAFLITSNVNNLLNEATAMFEGLKKAQTFSSGRYDTAIKSFQKVSAFIVSVKDNNVETSLVFSSDELSAISHSLNNPLAIIVAMISKLKMNQSKPSKTNCKEFMKIESNIERIKTYLIRLNEMANNSKKRVDHHD